MSEKYVKRIRTSSGDLQIDYNELANLPNIPETSDTVAVLTSGTTSYKGTVTSGTQIGTITINNKAQKIFVPGTADRVQGNLVIELNGEEACTFNGSTDISVDITPNAIGAATEGHTHDYKYASSSKQGGAADSVQGNLTIEFNGEEACAFNGSADISVDITPDAIGASKVDHTHADYDNFIADANDSMVRIRQKTSDDHISEFHDGKEDTVLKLKLLCNTFPFDGSTTQDGNWPTPASPAIVPNARIYWIYHASSRNLFNKNSLNYGDNCGTEDAAYATSDHIYLHSKKPLYVKAINIPLSIGVSLIGCYRKEDGTYTYGGLEALTTGINAEVYAENTSDGYLDSICININDSSMAELTEDTVADLQILVSFDSTLTEYEEGEVNLYKFTPGDDWNAASNYAGTIDLNTGSFQSIYGCVKLSDLADLTWIGAISKAEGDDGTQTSLKYYYTKDVVFDSFTSEDFFCTHYQVVDANNTNRVTFGISYYEGTLKIFDDMSTATESAFVDHLASLGGMIIYKRSSPLSYNISTPNIYCYEGANYIYAECDQMEVKYNIPWTETKTVYSTVETRTNDIWIDGKPIYRMVVKVGSVTKSSTTKVVMNTGELDTVISLRGTGVYGTGTIRPLPFASSTDGNIISLGISTYATTPTIQITAGSSGALSNVIVIVEYTKTTD